MPVDITSSASAPRSPCVCSGSGSAPRHAGRSRGGRRTATSVPAITSVPPPRYGDGNTASHAYVRSRSSPAMSGSTNIWFVAQPQAQRVAGERVGADDRVERRARRVGPTLHSGSLRSHGCSARPACSANARAAGRERTGVAGASPSSVSDLALSIDACAFTPGSITVIGDSTSSTAMRSIGPRTCAGRRRSRPTAVSTSIGYGSPENSFVSKLSVIRLQPPSHARAARARALHHGSSCTVALRPSISTVPPTSQHVRCR